METTRHFTATVYVVNDGATALHPHDRLGIWLPPGGHVDRDELPHEAALREAREETGLEVAILEDRGTHRSETARPLPRPRHLMLEDINVCDGQVGHQHVDFIYYGSAETRTIDPGPDELRASAWEWFTPEELARSEFDADTVAMGIEAIEAVGRD